MPKNWTKAPKYSTEAYEIGNYIARKRWVLITGGKDGIMKDVSRGAADADGIVIGILPGDDFSEANLYCNIIIPTGIGYARNIINILSSDALIAIGGKAGTLSALAYAWQFGKPVILCTFAEGWSSQLSTMHGGKIDSRQNRKIYSAETPNTT